MARQIIYDQGNALSTIDAILKEDYVMNKIVDAVNKTTYLLQAIGEEGTGTGGRKFSFPVQIGVAEGQGSRGENEDLPDEGAGEYVEASGNVRYEYGALYITGQAIEATQGAGAKASYVPALKQGLKDVRDGFKLNTHRQVWGDGSGTLGTVASAVTSSTTVPVTNPYGLTYVTASLTNGQKTRPYRRGMMVYFGTAALARKITSINGDGSVEVDTAVTLAAGETIVRGDATNKTSANKEVRGISEICKTTGTYLNIPRAGTPEWQANLIQLGSGTGGSITEDVMQSALDTNDQYGTDEPDTIVCEHTIRRHYVKLLQADRRFVSPMELKGGFKAVEYNGKPLYVDKMAPPQRMYFLRLANIRWMVMKNIGWISRDGTILKWVEKKDAYRAYLAAYRDLICEAPSNQTVLFDITG